MYDVQGEISPSQAWNHRQTNRNNNTMNATHTLRCAALHCTALHCTALRCAALR
jgi:hypothetical protein